jgi:hypothetical protein
MAANPTLAEVSALLAAVKALLRRAANRSWRPNWEEAGFLKAMADFFGPHLPPEALTSGVVALAYLRTAKSNLEAAFHRLMEEAQPRHPYRIA